MHGVAIATSTESRVAANVSRGGARLYDRRDVVFCLVLAWLYGVPVCVGHGVVSGRASPSLDVDRKRGCGVGDDRAPGRAWKKYACHHAVAADLGVDQRGGDFPLLPHVVGFVMRAAWLSRATAVLLCLSVLAWTGWLWHMRKTLADYAIDAARSAPSVPMCPWVAVESPAISSLGLSRETPLAWTDSTQALLAFRTAGEPPSYVDVGMVEARPPAGATSAGWAWPFRVSKSATA